MENNYIGKKINHLTILRYINKTVNYKTIVEVQCDCDKQTVFNVILENLKTGNTKSCGCYNIKRNIETKKKYNTYDLTGDYGIGYTLKGEEFYFDLEDYNLIKNHYWVTKNNRPYARINNKNVALYKLILNSPPNEIVDHINRNPLDNRKSNLRIVNRTQNGMNRIGRGKMSKFGLKGINWNKTIKKWNSKISKYKQIVYNKNFNNITEAIYAKIEAEQEHFGKYRYAWENDIKWDELLEYEKELKNNILN